MECFEINNLSFSYPKSNDYALSDVNITIHSGEFVTLCGKSGCGKTTLLRLLKSVIAPIGNKTGKILYNGKSIDDYSLKEQAESIGFVMQSPDNQIVTDKVWHELSFGLESLGMPNAKIRTKVSEMASFFGIQSWFHKNVEDLSGGQKQILNLASVMVMQPNVLILDEPTSQLDPIAAQEFLKTLNKINREIGTTIILSEHRLEDAFPMSDRIIVMDEGRIIADGTHGEILNSLKEMNHDMCMSLPVPMRIYSAIENDFDCPIDVCEGRLWLEKMRENVNINSDLLGNESFNNDTKEPVVILKDAYFRYDKNLPDVIKGLNVTVNKGELFAIVGGNGTGKTTALSLIAGLNIPYRGKVIINGQDIAKIPNLYDAILGVLPQDPTTLFVKKTVRQDLIEILSEEKISLLEKNKRADEISTVCKIETLLERHPYDLSGGEQQRVALAKILLKKPSILLLDEPTKGMDAYFKCIFKDVLINLKENGITIIMVSHDIEFCAENADRCAMFFDGNITSCDVPRKLFAGNSFYTTSTNRMARGIIPNAVVCDDVVMALGGKVTPRVQRENNISFYQNNTEESPKYERHISLFNVIIAFLMVCLSFGLSLSLGDLYTDWRDYAVDILVIAVAAVGLFRIIPQKDYITAEVVQPHTDRKLSKRTLIASLLVLIAIPLTIFFGIYYLNDRKYYFISLLIIFEGFIPFFVSLESKKNDTRKLIIISVMCAIAVCGRIAFFMIPQFKPTVAVVMICGICFGLDAGFLVGAISAFVSNSYFGHGVWTPWQMFAMGMIGFVSGLVFRKGFITKKRTSLCIFGFFATLVLYGAIMDFGTVIMMQPYPTKELIVSTFAMGFPMNVIHGVSTAFFMYFISDVMIEKIDRIKTKYGIK